MGPGKRVLNGDSGESVMDDGCLHPRGWGDWEEDTGETGMAFLSNNHNTQSLIR